MDKDKNIYITPELYQSKIKKIENIKIEKFKVLFSNSFVQLKQVKNKEEIHIYDIGNNNTPKQSIIYINNHINKTGENPLRGIEQDNIQFYDVTEIYQQNNKGKLAICYGNNKHLNTKEDQVSVKFLCNHAINAHVLGFKKIYGYAVI